MTIETALMLTALVTAVLSAVVGTVLLVRRDSMIAEGLSHAVLPGIVIGFLLAGDIHSPWLTFAATIGGLVMVWSVSWLRHTRRIDPDAALGIVFSAMFSVGVLIVSKFMRNTTFHPQAIIDGQLTLSIFDEYQITETIYVPKALITMTVVLAVISIFLIVVRKEMRMMMFDPVLSRRFGYRPVMIEAIWVALVSLAVVAMFEVAGSVLVVALMVAPAAAAYLLTRRFSVMLTIAIGIAVSSALIGYAIGEAWEISPSAPMGSVAGAIFLLAMVVRPGRGGWFGINPGRKRRLDACIVRDLRTTNPRDDAEALAEKLGWTPRRVQRAIHSTPPGSTGDSVA